MARASRMVKIIMRPRVRSISGARQVVHGTESCLHSRLPGWVAEKAGRCPSPDDCVPDDNDLHTDGAHATGSARRTESSATALRPRLIVPSVPHTHSNSVIGVAA